MEAPERVPRFKGAAFLRLFFCPEMKMKSLLCMVLLLNIAFAEEQTVHTPKEVEQKFDPYANEGVEKFDPYAITPPVAKPKAEKEKKGLIDGIIDGVKAGTETGKKKIEEVTGKIIRSEYLRENSIGTVMLGYQPFTTWIPGKWAASYTHIFDRNWSLEGEYSRGTLSVPVFSVDIGEIKEERATLQARYYPGNSYNWSVGLMYQRGEAELGADIPATSSLDVFEMESFGATLGFGNRWQWDNGITFAVDWFRVNQPLFGRWENESVLKTVSDNDRDDLKKIMRAFNTLPTFIFLGIHLGYTF